MKITLVKKTEQGDRDPLLVQWETEENGKLVKKTVKVQIGQSLELPEEEAYALLAKYKGLFKLSDAVPVQQKVMKQYADKAMATT